MTETPTPRLGLGTYDYGDDEWSHTDTVRWIDEHGVQHGTLANRPDTGTYHGEPYHALDVGITFYWDDGAESWGYMAGFGDENHRINRTLYLATLDVNDLVGIDAADLDGEAGADGQVLQTDGAEASWTDIDTGAFDGTTESLSVTGWDVIDVSNHGFAGDQTGGDLAQFVADTIAAGGQYVFYLPRGTYDWERPVLMTGGTGTHEEPVPEGFAIVGRPEATLHVDMPTDSERLLFRLGTSSNGLPRARLENLHIDIGTADDARDAGIMRAYISDRGHFETLSLTRRKKIQDDGTTDNGDRHTFKLDVIDEAGVAVVKDVRLPNGDVYQPDADSVGHAIPFASEPDHVGTTFWINCYVEGFTDNGFYLRDGPGSNRLYSCTAKNCSAGMFRLGRNDYAEGITAIADAGLEYNGTPLWIEEYRRSVPEPIEDNQEQYSAGDEDDSPVVVSDFQLLATGGPVNDVIRISHNIPEVRLEGGYVRCGVDEYVLDATHHTGKLSVRDLTVDDHATGATRLAAIHLDAANIQFENLTYRADPASGNGRSVFWVDDEGTRLKVTDSDLQCTAAPLIEGETGGEFTMVDSRCENSATDPSILRLNSTPMESLRLRANDFRDYSTSGLGADPANINYYRVVGNRGVPDQSS